MNRQALISVSDKRGVVEFARGLQALGFDVISTGGTFNALQSAGIDCKNISEITNFPECLDGRVKTLHPAVHAGILAMRSNPAHTVQLEQLNIKYIDVVAVNLYPFKETISRPDATLEDAVENIDIGGPTMLRSAAKNYKDVYAVCDPADYETVLAEIKNKEEKAETRFKLMYKVYQHTALYDTLIANYLREKLDIASPDTLTLAYEKAQPLRYGENPHQNAAFYMEVSPAPGTLPHAQQLHGKELSFNNINDAGGALALLKEFDVPAVVAVKHTNPCGVGTGKNIYEAYLRAYECDKISVFGGIIAANGTVDSDTAAEINKIFIEIVIAKDFTDSALEILKQKKNIRLLKLDSIEKKVTGADLKKVPGGLLMQDLDSELYKEADFKIVTKKAPTAAQVSDLQFAYKVAKHTKSNAIVLASGSQTTGIGAGQTNRIWAAQQAIEHAGDRAKGSVMASDAFFPFDDCVECAAKAGITAIIQPGGSIRDADSIAACDKYGIAMVFCNMRHFKH